MAFPPPPVDHIDWSNVGFNVKEVNGHVESRFSMKTGVWTEPAFVRDPVLRIHGLAPALHYGQQAYEGLKAFRTKDGQISIFRAKDHAARLAHSASFVVMPAPPVSVFISCVQLAVSRNAAFVPPCGSGASLYIRPVLFGSSAQMILSPPDEYMFCVFIQPASDYHGIRPLDALIMEEFDRVAPKGTGAAKIGGNYAPVMRWAGKARMEGFGITLHLDSKTNSWIEEFSSAGFIGVFPDGDKFTLVIPDTPNAIKSITGESCIDLARHLGWAVEVRPVHYDELAKFSEVIAVGTAAALVAIKSISCKSKTDNFLYPVAADVPGPCCTKLSGLLKDIQQGNSPDLFGWRLQVEDIPNVDEVHNVEDIPNVDEVHNFEVESKADDHPAQIEAAEVDEIVKAEDDVKAGDALPVGDAAPVKDAVNVDAKVNGIPKVDEIAHVESVAANNDDVGAVKEVVNTDDAIKDDTIKVNGVFKVAEMMKADEVVPVAEMIKVGGVALSVGA